MSFVVSVLIGGLLALPFSRVHQNFKLGLLIWAVFASLIFAWVALVRPWIARRKQEKLIRDMVAAQNAARVRRRV